MKKLILAIVLLPFFIYADLECFSELTYDEVTYCFLLDWGAAETKQRGAFYETETLSPYLNRERPRSDERLYSKVSVKVVEKENKEGEGVKIEGLKIFPYMYMDRGGHHGTSYISSWSEEQKTYELKGIYFQAMMGYWMLKWSLKEDMSESTELMRITNFSNESEETGSPENN